MTRRRQAKFKKNPDAPRRFKSSFMFFSQRKHPELRKQMIENGVQEGTIETTDVAKLVAATWKTLSEEEREEYEILARRDKERYEEEKKHFRGPWKVPAKQRAPKDPNAPKRPMSAFLSYSNSLRTKVKKDNPNMETSQVTQLLATMWKAASDEEKREFVEEETKLMNEYKIAMAEWRQNNQEVKRAAREEREEQAMQRIDARKLGFYHHHHQQQQQQPMDFMVTTQHQHSSYYLPYYNNADGAAYPSMYHQHQQLPFADGHYYNATYNDTSNSNMNQYYGYQEGYRYNHEPAGWDPPSSSSYPYPPPTNSSSSSYAYNGGGGRGGQEMHQANYTSRSNSHLQEHHHHNHQTPSHLQQNDEESHQVNSNIAYSNHVDMQQQQEQYYPYLHQEQQSYY